MTIPLGYVTGIFATVTSSVIGWLFREKIRECLIATPKNSSRITSKLLNTINLGTPKSKVKKILGEPDSINREYEIYKLYNIFLALKYGEKDTVETLTVLLTKTTRVYKLTIPNLELFKFSLGDTKFSEFSEYAQEKEMKVRTSSKHGEIAVCCYFGMDGGYKHYVFGAFDGVDYPYRGEGFSVSMMDDKFYGDFKILKPNYFSISYREMANPFLPFWPKSIFG